MRWVPGLALFRDYRREWLSADLLAGVSDCVVMIPSVIAYAGLMGLSPQHGLYAALVPLLVYPFFGSSRQVIVGPDIAISLLIASAIAPLAAGDPSRAAVLAAIGLAFKVGFAHEHRDFGGLIVAMKHLVVGCIIGIGQIQAHDGRPFGVVQ